jgi:hypothetical protein
VRRVAGWLAGRAPREQALIAVAAGVAALVALAIGLRAARDELAALRARVAGHERELAAVRRAAAALAAGAEPAAPDADGSALLARLEAAADEALGRERIAGMTPGAGPVEDGLAEERVALAVRDASLAETVRLLHRLETAAPPLHVVRLELRKHPDDPARFDATVEVATLRAAP